MNILMISIGDDVLTNPLGNSLDRQKKYATSLGFIDMIVYSKKNKNLEAKHYDNISIYPSKSINMLSFIFDVLKISKEIIKRKHIDVITTQDPFGTALAGYLLKKKYNIVLHIQNHSSFLDNKLWIGEKPFLFTIFNQLSHFTIKKADRLRVVNTKEKQKYIDILKIDEDKIDVAPLPVNVKFWQEIPKKIELEKFIKKYNIDSSKPVLFWAGRLVKVKNLPYLYDVISKVKKITEVNFLVAGDIKNSFFDLDNLSNKYKIKPIYLGLLSHKEMKIAYYISDIYLHTSNYEGFGLVVSDAEACGTVVVSRCSAGSNDIIEHEKSGYLVDGDEDEFSAIVLELLKNKEKIQKMSKYAKDMMKDKFDELSMFKEIINSIKNTVNVK